MAHLPQKLHTRYSMSLYKDGCSNPRFSASLGFVGFVGLGLGFIGFRV